MCWRFVQFLDIETVQLVKSTIKQYKNIPSANKVTLKDVGKIDRYLTT